MTTDRILFVDDDVNLLSAMRRSLRKRFDLVTAEGGAAALELIATEGPFAVVVADMRMPGMDGVELLKTLAETHPETVRVMLTGNADQATAVDAINSGRIFRFLNKPSDPDRIAETVTAALRQHHLETAEKVLLEHTLAGSVKVLTDVLAMSRPEIFGRARLMKNWCETIAEAMGTPKGWEIGLAALLAPLGHEALAPETRLKLESGAALEAEEREAVDRAPEHAARLIRNIPRLGDVSEMVLLQNRGFDGTGFPEDGPSGSAIPMGARILHAVKDLAKATGGKTPNKEHLAVLTDCWSGYDTKVLAAIDDRLACLKGMEEDLSEVQEMVKSRWLRDGDEIMDDLTTTDGRLVLPAGSRLTSFDVQKLRNFETTNKLAEPIRVRRQAA